MVTTLRSFSGFSVDDVDARGVARSTDPSLGPTIGWIADPAGNVIALIED